MIAALLLALLLALATPAAAPAESHEGDFAERLVAAALERTRHAVRYDGRYLRLDYPGGDVPADTGVCTDVVIRSYRAVGIDLAFARRWAEVIEEWSVRYGDQVAGWWFDGGYEWVGFNEDIARIYAEAARRGDEVSVRHGAIIPRRLRHTARAPR